MESTVILGLSVNARMLGLAVIEGDNLVDYQIQLRKEAWSPRKRELILASLHSCCKGYNITSVAMSTQHEYQTSEQTKDLLEAITSYFKSQKIHFSYYPPKGLYPLCKEGKGKKEIMKTLTQLYPELSTYYQREMRNKNKYYIKLFEAIGVATIHSQKLNKAK